MLVHYALASTRPLTLRRNPAFSRMRPILDALAIAAGALTAFWLLVP
jgi:hypothetical protein